MGDVASRIVVFGAQSAPPHLFAAVAAAHAVGVAGELAELLPLLSGAAPPSLVIVAPEAGARVDEVLGVVHIAPHRIAVLVVAEAEQAAALRQAGADAVCEPAPQAICTIATLLLARSAQARHDAALEALHAALRAPLPQQLDGVVVELLASVGELFGIQWINVASLDGALDTLTIRFQWHDARVPATRSALQHLPLKTMAPLLAPLWRGEPVLLPDLLAVLDGELRARVRDWGGRTLLLIPLRSDGNQLGFLMATSTRPAHPWPPEAVRQLHRAADPIAQLLAIRSAQASSKRLEAFVDRMWTFRTRLVEVPLSGLPAFIEQLLEEICAFFEMNRALLFDYVDDPETLRCIAEWDGPGLPSVRDFYASVRRVDYPWLFDQVFDDQIAAFSALEDIPIAGQRIRKALALDDTRAVLIAPLRLDGVFLGVLALAQVGRTRVFREADLAAVRHCARILATAAAQRDARRIQAQHEVLDGMLVSLSTDLINQPADQIDAAIDRVLGVVGTHFQVQRCLMFVFGDEHTTFRSTHEWRTPDAMSVVEPERWYPNDALPSTVAALQRGEVVVVNHPSELPEESRALQRIMRAHAGLAQLCVPLVVAQRTIGAVILTATRQKRVWSPEELSAARRCAKILANAMARQQAQRRLQAQTAQMRAILQRITDAFFAIEADGRCSYANAQAAALLGVSQEEIIGASLCEVVASAFGAVAARRLEAGLAQQKTAALELELPKRWLEARIHPGDAKATLFLTDITARKTVEASLRGERDSLQHQLRMVYDPEGIIGFDAGLSGVHQQIGLVAPTASTVLITGETGTGKELIARRIHERSQRRSRILVKVNCAALVDSLAESELFGHEKGSFTGATQRRRGRFEQASGGTLFLDEVGELSLTTQAKLLRVLQEGEFERVGSSQTIKVDVRIVAATNRDLAAAVQEGTFRRDLFFRLNVFPIHLPALRERQDDLPALVAHFIGRYGRRGFRGVSPAAMAQLRRYSWPGNVRELENVIQRAVIVAQGDEIQARDLLIQATPAGASGGTLEDVERLHILHTLEATDWRVQGPDGAASRLGMNPSTLRSRMKKLGLKRPSA